MADLNAIQLTGRLTKDPELRSTANGQSVASFRIAASGFREGDTLFLDVSAWGKQAEPVSRYTKKGSRVAVSGRLKQREWTAQDGSKRTAYEVAANDVVFLDTREEGQRPAPQAQSPNDDDVPF